MKLRELTLNEMAATGGGASPGGPSGPSGPPSSPPSATVPTLASTARVGARPPGGGHGLSQQGDLAVGKGGIFLGHQQAQEPHNYDAESQVGQGLEWPKAAGATQTTDVKRDEVEMPGQEHHVGHHDDGDAGVATESIIREFAPAGGGSGGNYLKALASAWYNMDFEMLRDLVKQGKNAMDHRINVQQTIEKMLERGIHCGDGKVRKYSIDYNADFDGVEIQSHDHYEYADNDDAGNDIDSRTGKPWGPYDVVAFHDTELDESIIREFAPVGGDDREPNEEEILRQLASMWWLGSEQQMAKAQKTLAAMGWEIGQDESGDDDAGVFLIRPGDVNGDTYMAFNHSDLSLDESRIVEDGEATVSADIATVAYPMSRGRTRREKRRNARRAVGQSFTAGPPGVGTGVFEASLATMRDYFAGNDNAHDTSDLTLMRNYFSKIDKDIPETIQRILWKVKNNVSLKPMEYSQYKTWMQNRRKMKEAHVLDHQNVIYRLDKDKPMTDTEVLVLGGAGRYTLGGLRDKARREADAMAADLKVEHGGSFRRASENIKQLTNTLNTIVAAYNELARIRRKGGRGSRGITDEESNFMRECTQRMNTLELYTRRVKQAQRIVEGIHHYLAEDKMSHEQASIIKGMFHLNTDPGYGFYRYAIHVAGNQGGDKVVLGPNAGPFAYAYTKEEEKMIKDAVKAITGSEPMELTGGKSKEPDFVNKNSTVPSIDWKKVK